MMVIHSLSLTFDPHNHFILSKAIDLIKYVVGITVSPDGSKWRADNSNNQLMKF